ncbi:MAG: dihydropteroate synthase [Deltaproteobacteria bacterium]|nr:dihydropteroate synthase [Deltaproteobacteria bacterium]
MPFVFAPVQVGAARWDGHRCYVIGVVNVTPDSFSDGGLFLEAEVAVQHGLTLVNEGADALDVGGESTRPGSEPVAVDVELERVLPVVRALAPRTQVPLSIDTTKAEVARQALAAGASIVNDVSGFRLDPAMAEVVARADATVILGHLRGRPATMQDGIAFEDVVAEVIDELKAAIRTAVRAGIRAERIWADPGLGFGKTATQTTALLAATGEIREALGVPLMVGPSRKSFLGVHTGQNVGDRVMATAAAVTAGILAGANAVRVHDVGALLPAVRVADAVRGARATRS